MSDTPIIDKLSAGLDPAWTQHLERAAELERQQRRIWERHYKAEFPAYDDYMKAKDDVRMLRYLRYGPTSL